jgi:hypothetical protein
MTSNGLAPNALRHSRNDCTEPGHIFPHISSSSTVALCRFFAYASIKYMTQYKDPIPLGTGKVEYQYDPESGVMSCGISGSFRALYQVAVSMNGRELLAFVNATGYGQRAVYPQPSVLTFIQSDEQMMWGRNCPVCGKYFRTKHISDFTCCPYCTITVDSLDFISKDQRKYIRACHDAFAKAYTFKRSESLELEAVTDKKSAWHYSEEKLQVHFTCATEKCGVETDVLGVYAYCPRCGLSNSRKLFFEKIEAMVKELEEVRSTITDPAKRDEVWERMTKQIVTDFEVLGNHLRLKLLLTPMTKNRRRELKKLSFQMPLQVDKALQEWFDISLFRWVGNEDKLHKEMKQAEIDFVKLMLLKRHVLTHTAIVDQDYLDKSGDTSMRLGERMTIASNEIKRFITNISEMALYLLDNLEFGLMAEG